jgi:hypothetical protein
MGGNGMNKKHTKPNPQGRLIVPVIFYAFTVAILSTFIWQLIRHDLYKDGLIYLGVLVAMAWWAFSFACVYVALRFVASGASIVFGILAFLVGIIGAINLATSLGYPRLIAWLIYFLIPFLFASVLLSIQLPPNQ